MTKVQKLFQNKTPQAGYLSILVYYLSKLYILPLNINHQEGTIKFAFLSFRTLIHVLVVSIPFGLSLTWIFLQPTHYLKDCWKAFFHVFETSDILIMSFYPGITLLPPMNLMLTSIVSKAWASHPDLTFHQKLQFPRNIKCVSYSFILLIVSIIFVFWGLFWSMSIILTQYSTVRNFVTFFLALGFPSIFNIIMLFIYSIMWYSMMDQIQDKIKNPPQDPPEIWVWARESIHTFQRFAECSHMHFFVFIALR